MEIREKLASILRNVVPTIVIRDDEDYNQPLSKLGVDSLDRMTLLLDIQETFDLDDIPDEKAQQLSTISEIAEYVEKQSNRKES